jgi:hypothetical protein
MNRKLFRNYSQTAALVAAFSLAGCASWCAPNDTQCKQDMQNADLVAGAAVVIAADIAAPAPTTTTTTETSTCSTDFWGNKTCTTTTEEH